MKTFSVIFLLVCAALIFSGCVVGDPSLLEPGIRAMERERLGLERIKNNQDNKRLPPSNPVTVEWLDKVYMEEIMREIQVRQVEGRLKGL